MHEIQWLTWTIKILFGDILALEKGHIELQQWAVLLMDQRYGGAEAWFNYCSASMVKGI